MARHTTAGTIIVTLLVALSSGLTAEAETIVLENGRTITAEIIKQDEQVVILDLGYDLLRVPRSRITAIHEDRPSEPDPNEVTADNPLPINPESSGLYRTARLAKTTTERNVARFGEAVVLISTPSGRGSGFLINEDGHLITNYHVIARETLIKATVFHKTAGGFEQKRYDKIKIIAFNPYVDLALLKIENADRQFEHVYLGAMNRVNVGETVFAVGNPLGLTRSVSQGIVSTTNRDFEGRLYIQTTADIAPGNSGGPLFNLCGEVIGVTSMGYLAYGGLNFAVPVDVVRRFIENWDAFAYRPDNPNSGFRYLQPAPRQNHAKPPNAKLPEMH